jgi:hypothetical protein
VNKNDVLAIPRKARSWFCSAKHVIKPCDLSADVPVGKFASLATPSTIHHEKFVTSSNYNRVLEIATLEVCTKEVANFEDRTCRLSLSKILGL